jgi:hypothetical protein
MAQSEYPFRLQVLRALTAVLESITPENGYTYDLSGSVFRGRIIFGESDPLPMVSILEPPIPPDPIQTPLSGTEQILTWDLLIQGFVKDDSKNPTDPAHFMLADIRQALVRERERAQDSGIFGLNARVRNLDFGSPVIRPSDDISSKAYFYLPIFLSVVESLSDPYLDIQLYVE